jgi:hypothetical protein
MANGGKIERGNPNRWFCVSTNEQGVRRLILFGYVGELNVNQVETGRPNMNAFPTEDALELFVDTIGGADYYKNAVETEGEKFQPPSQKY